MQSASAIVPAIDAAARTDGPDLPPQVADRWQTMGWNIAGTMMLISAAMQLFFGLMAAGASHNSNGAGLVMLFLVGTLLVTIILAIGLIGRSVIAKWIALFGACSAGVFFVVVGIQVADHEAARAVAPIAGGSLLIVGWLLLLDSKPNRAKVLSGTVMVILANVLMGVSLATIR